MFSKENKIYQLIALVTTLVCIITYSYYLNSEFIYDDLLQIVHNKSIGNIHNLEAIIKSQYRKARVLQNLSFAIDWQISSSEPWFFRITNLVLFIINLFIINSIQIRLNFSKNFRLIFWSLFISLPLHQQIVNYIMGRISLFESLFFLLAILFSLEGKKYGYFKIAVLYLFSPLAKESCILIPIIVLFIDLHIHKKKLSDLSKKFYLILFLLSLIYFPYNKIMADRGVSMHHGVVGFDLYPMGRYLITQSYYFGFYILLFLNPYYQSIIHGFPSFNNVILLVGILMMILKISWAFIAFRFRNRDPIFFLFSFLFLFFWGLNNSILQFINPFAEYRLFLQNIFLVTLLLWVVKKYFANLIVKIKRVIPILLVFAIIFNIFFLVNVLEINKVASLSYAHSLDIYPKFPRLNLIIYDTLKDIKSPLSERFLKDAVEDYEMDPFPKSATYYMTIISYYYDRKDYEKTEFYINKIRGHQLNADEACILFNISFMNTRYLQASDKQKEFLDKNFDKILKKYLCKGEASDFKKFLPNFNY